MRDAHFGCEHPQLRAQIRADAKRNRRKEREEEKERRAERSTGMIFAVLVGHYQDSLCSHGPEI